MPVIVVGCMLDKRGDQQPISLEQVMSPIMQQFREIETCIECSAVNNIQVKSTSFTEMKNSREINFLSICYLILKGCECIEFLIQ